MARLRPTTIFLNIDVMKQLLIQSLLTLSLVLPLLFCSTQTYANERTPEVEVKMLYGGGAFVIIDGRQQQLKVGATGDRGVKLLKATTKQGVFLIDGKRVSLGMSRRIGGTYRAAPKAITRIAEGFGGHFYADVVVNGRSSKAVIDTGATSIAMSASQARALDIDYRQGQSIRVATASGTANAYRIFLDRVKVGSAEGVNVEASVIEGDGPPVILIGNTFLRNFNMSIQAGVMTLEHK